jgi:hypothetical protein
MPIVVLLAGGGVAAWLLTRSGTTESLVSSPSLPASPSRATSPPVPSSGSAGSGIGWITNIKATITDHWPPPCTPSPSDPFCLAPEQGYIIIAVTFDPLDGHTGSDLLDGPVTLTSASGTVHTVEAAGFQPVGGVSVNFMLFTVELAEGIDFTLNWPGYPSLPLTVTPG